MLSSDFKIDADKFNEYIKKNVNKNHCDPFRKALSSELFN